MISFHDANDHIQQYERAANGLITATVLPDGNSGTIRTEFTYNEHGLRTQIKYADGTTETWTYETGTHSHKPRTYTDQLNRTWTYTYDAFENLETIRDPLWNVTTYSYTSRGLVETITGPDPDGTEGELSRACDDVSIRWAWATHKDHLRRPDYRRVHLQRHDGRPAHGPRSARTDHNAHIRCLRPRPQGRAA